MTLNSHQLEAEHLNIILLIVCICFIVCVFIPFLFCFVTEIVMSGCFYEYAVVVLTECKLTGVVVEPPAASPCSWKFKILIFLYEVASFLQLYLQSLKIQLHMPPSDFSICGWGLSFSSSALMVSGHVDLCTTFNNVHSVLVSWASILYGLRDNC